jgi:hypothetical protein
MNDFKHNWHLSENVDTFYYKFDSKVIKNTVDMDNFENAVCNCIKQ